MNISAVPPPLKRGFSLLEIAIVLVVIALITGAVLGAASLKRTLALKNMMDDISRISQGYGQFKDIYKAVPGDFFNAESAFGAANTDNGNGNELIDTSAEQSLSFQHMALAGLIQGSYTTTYQDSAVSNSSIPNGKYYLWYAPVWTSGYTYNFVSAAVISDSDNDGTLSGSIEHYGAILSPQEMYKIDKKYDNGIPTSGLFMGYDAYDATANSCISGGAYVTTSKFITCIFAVAVDKKF